MMKRPYEMIQEFTCGKLMTDDTKFGITKLVEEVLTYERERCALIAENQSGGMDDCCGVHVCNCPGIAIARKIRRIPV